MIDVVMVRKAIKDGQIKVVWKEAEPNLIRVYLANVIRADELGDMIKLCDIKAVEVAEAEREDVIDVIEKEMDASVYFNKW